MASTQTTISTRTPDEIVALRQKYRENIARLEAKRASLQHLTKIRQPLKAATLFNWVQEGALVVAEWNRDEVKGREGSAEEWMESLASKVSAGQFIAYHHGKVPKNGQIKPTKERPIVVYEGGHRTRWTANVFRNLVQYEGLTYEQLCDAHPDTAAAIANCVIEMTLAVSENEDRLVAFAKNEYHKVNTKGERLTDGEVIKAGSDTTRGELERELGDAFQRDLKPKARDSHLEDLRVLVHGAAGRVAEMNKKKGSLTNVGPLTDEEVRKAREVIEEVARIEARIAELPELSATKTQKRVRARIIDLKVDGTLVWALQHAEGPQEREMVAQDWVDYHRRFFPSPAMWKEKLAELKTSTVERSRYKAGETPYPGRWLRIHAVLHPVVAVARVEEVPAGEAM